MSKRQILAQGISVAMGLDVDYQGSAIVVLDIRDGPKLYEGRLPHDEAA